MIFTQMTGHNRAHAPLRFFAATFSLVRRGQIESMRGGILLTCPYGSH
jgi:hypothetical protein